MATNKRTGPARLDWAAEKNGPAVLAEDRARLVSLPHPGESLIGGSYMECCGFYRCVCVCPGCGERSVTGMVCRECEHARDCESAADVNGVSQWGAW